MNSLLKQWTESPSFDSLEKNLSIRPFIASMKAAVEMQKKYKVGIIASLLLSTVTGCTYNGQMTPVAMANQKQILRAGSPTILSVKKAVVTIAPEGLTDNERGGLVVAVLNASQNAFDFTSANISISSGGKNYHVYTYNELAQEIEDKRKAAAIAAAFSGMAASMNAANAGYTYNSGTVTTYGSGYSSNGISSSYSGVGTYSGYSYNPAAAQAAQQAAQSQTMANLGNIQARGDAQLAALSQSVLKGETVLPGEWYGGVVKFDVPDFGSSPASLIIQVEADSEIHEFEFTLSKTQR